MYTHITIVRDRYLTKAWSAFFHEVALFENSVCRCSLKGDFRKNPIPWLYVCRQTVGYAFRTVQMDNLRRLEKATHHDGKYPGAEVSAVEVGKGRA